MRGKRGTCLVRLNHVETYLLMRKIGRSMQDFCIVIKIRVSAAKYLNGMFLILGQILERNKYENDKKLSVEIT